MEVDIPRKRIALSMKSDPFGANPAPVKKEVRKKVQNNLKAQPPKRKEESMEDKLAQLKAKFGK